MKTRLLVAALAVLVVSVTAVDRNTGKAGNGFWYRSISFKTNSLDFVEYLGEMSNQSGKDFATTMFDLTIYDARNNVIGSDTFVINNFRRNSSRPIKGIMTDVDLNQISGYKIDYSMGVEE